MQESAGNLNIKIGYAKDDAEERRATIQPGNSSHLIVLLTLAGDRKEESRFHRLFAAHEVRREWFRPHPDLVRFIAANWNSGVLSGDPAGNLSCPVERNAVRFLIGLLSEHGCQAFSIRGPLGKEVDEEIKSAIGWTAGLNGQEGMRRVWDTVEEHVRRLYGEDAACGIMSALNYRFSGVGKWAA